MSQRINIIIVVVFVLAVIFLQFSSYPEKWESKKCCEFEEAHIDGVLIYATHGKSGNVFKLENDKAKNYTFSNKGNFGKNLYKDFWGMAKKGQRVLKPMFSDTLFLFDGDKRIFFEILDCCNE